MIPLDAEVFVAIEPIDLRASFDMLSGYVREQFGAEPKSGALFVFFGKRREKLKAIFYDKNGFVIVYKRLCRGTFRIPTPDRSNEKTVQIPEEMFLALLEGLGADALDAPKKKSHPVH